MFDKQELINIYNLIHKADIKGCEAETVTKLLGKIAGLINAPDAVQEPVVAQPEAE